MSVLGTPARPWSEFEDQLLLELARQGLNRSEMVPHMLVRSYGSICARLNKRGIKTNRRGRHYAKPPGRMEQWSEAERLCAFANVPLSLAKFVVDTAKINRVELTELRSDARRSDLVKIRAKIARTARQSRLPLETIGRAINRDHTTVLHLISSRHLSTENVKTVSDYEFDRSLHNTVAA